MTSHELRQKYLDFFKARGHAVLPSAPLLPDNDPTTLFTSSGMQPLVPFLLGEKHPEGNRLVNSQRCFRAVDMDEVGDNRHTTFFEMLGNWSLGSYFKAEQIPWVFEFLTTEVGLDPKRLYGTVFGGNAEIGIPRDDEAVALWKEVYAQVGIDAIAYADAVTLGMRDGRIFYYDEKKNWWSRSGVPANMPVGEPGGPDTEIFWDFGVERELHEQSPWKALPCHVNCDCGRFFEIGNSVFMQYQRVQEGFKELPQKNVDFGGGLERIAAALNDSPDMFLIDLFAKSKTILEQSSGKSYGADPEHTKAFRVVMDHLRAATFLIADGALPSNKDQGYFTRRLMRRAIRFGNVLDLRPGFCADVAAAVIEEYARSMPYLTTKKDDVALIMQAEEEKFRKTLAVGLKVFEQASGAVSAGGTLPTQQTFDLYQSYGFPVEMTQELAVERGIMIDRAAFDEELKKHQERSRSGAGQKFHGGLADHAVNTVRLHTANHMLLESMKRVLGRDVNQRGSNITSERLRLDFNYPERLTTQQIAEIETLTNEHLSKDLPVHYEVMPLEQARAENATGVFDERYSETVKVYKMGALGQYYSVEICGGPHVRHTSQVGTLKITKEEAVSAGIRRIKAVISGGSTMAEGEQAGEEYPGRS
ncbi:alanine--tRNA ligase [Candidatus Uhrbacteria bacterium]|nr:alanine--tRNA ligase [Candidatus Uhrbacteria bacterium]